jgi:hypothetical protein
LRARILLVLVLIILVAFLWIASASGKALEPLTGRTTFTVLYLSLFLFLERAVLARSSRVYANNPRSAFFDVRMQSCNVVKRTENLIVEMLLVSPVNPYTPTRLFRTLEKVHARRDGSLMQKKNYEASRGEPKQVQRLSVPRVSFRFHVLLLGKIV